MELQIIMVGEVSVKVGVAIGHDGLAFMVSALGVDEDVKGLVGNELIEVGLQHIEIYYILRNRVGRNNIGKLRGNKIFNDRKKLFRHLSLL